MFFFEEPSGEDAGRNLKYVDHPGVVFGRGTVLLGDFADSFAITASDLPLVLHGGIFFKQLVLQKRMYHAVDYLRTFLR